MPKMNEDKGNNKRKVNKNAVPRRSKLEFKSTSSEIKVEQSKNIENGLSLLQLSSPESDETTDSAFSSITSSSTTSDLLEENKFDWEGENNVFAIPGSASASSEKPVYIVPKYPVLQSARFVQTDCGARKETTIQLTKAKPRGIVAPLSNNPCRNEEEADDVRTDGPQSEVVPSGSRDPISSVTNLCTSSSSSELIHSDGMLDFVILHTDEDTEAACAYKAHLHHDTGINDLKVDLLSNIDAGKSEFQSLDSLHERYRFILTFVTDNLVSDRYCRFMQEIIITCGLREANGKEDRVVPVFTERGRCNILEISVLNGFQYFKFCSGGQLMKNMYIDSVKRLVQRGRTMFP